MKLGPVTKQSYVKKIWRHVIIRFFGQFRAVQRLDSGHKVCKRYVFSNKNLLSYKNWKQNYKTSNTALTLLLWVKVFFGKKSFFFCKKMLTSAKMRWPSYQKVYFLELHMSAYLRAKFEVSSIIIKGFRQGGFYPSPLPNEPLKSPPRLGLIMAQQNSIWKCKWNKDSWNFQNVFSNTLTSLIFANFSAFQIDVIGFECEI